MKTLAFFFALMVLPLSARLGETKAACNARYGTDISESLSGSRYDKNGIYIEVTYHKDVAVKIRFWVKSDKLFGEKLTDFQVQEILKANEAGSSWEVVNRDNDGKKLARKDSTAFAHWNYTAGDLELLSAFGKKQEDDERESTRRANAEAQRADAARKAAAEKKSVEGF